MTPVLELHQLLVNKCSHSMAIPTFNECIWTYRNRSWYKPAGGQPRRDQEMVNGTYGTSLSFLSCYYNSLVHRYLSLSQQSLSRWQRNLSRLAVWCMCRWTIATSTATNTGYSSPEAAVSCCHQCLVLVSKGAEPSFAGCKSITLTIEPWLHFKLKTKTLRIR